MHVKPHEVPLHVALPFVAAAHAMHPPPHVAVLVLLTHAPLQS